MLLKNFENLWPKLCSIIAFDQVHSHFWSPSTAYFLYLQRNRDIIVADVIFYQNPQCSTRLNTCVRNCCSPAKVLQYSLEIFPKNGILRKTTVMPPQCFSAAQARLSCCLKGEGAQLNEDQTLLCPRRKMLSSSQVYIGGCLAALQPWTRARAGHSLPNPFSWSWWGCITGRGTGRSL